MAKKKGKRRQEMLVFFDKSYFDLSFTARLHRQQCQFRCWKQKLLSKVGIYGKIIFVKWLIMRIKNSFKPKIRFNPVNPFCVGSEGHRPNYRNDPTVDGIIAEKGAIWGHHDKRYHTSKRSYMDSLRAMGKVIDDN